MLYISIAYDVVVLSHRTHFVVVRGLKQLFQLSDQEFLSDSVLIHRDR